jgi:hypothetical protein
VGPHTTEVVKLTPWVLNYNFDTKFLPEIMVHVSSLTRTKWNQESENNLFRMVIPPTMAHKYTMHIVVGKRSMAPFCSLFFTCIMSSTPFHTPTKSSYFA